MRRARLKVKPRLGTLRVFSGIERGHVNLFRSLVDAAKLGGPDSPCG